MDTQSISEERRAEILRKAREEREKRREQSQQLQTSQQNMSSAQNNQPAYDIKQANQTRQMIMASVLNNQNSSNSSAFKQDQYEMPNINKEDENLYRSSKKGEEYSSFGGRSGIATISPNNFSIYSRPQNPEYSNVAVEQSDNPNGYGVDELIREKLDQNPDLAVMSLADIKHRLTQKLKKNEEMQHSFKQHNQNISEIQERRNSEQISQSDFLSTVPKQSYRFSHANNQPSISEQQQQQQDPDHFFNQRESLSKSTSIPKNPFMNSARPPLPPPVYSFQTNHYTNTEPISSPHKFPWETDAENQDKFAGTASAQPSEEQSFYEKRRTNGYSQRRTEQEYIESLKYSFKPEIYDIPREIYGECDRLKISRSDQWERLLRDKIETLTIRENQKIVQQQKEIEQTCTFVPIISEISKHINTQKQQEDNEPQETDVVKRLYQDGLKKIQGKEELKRKYEDQQVFPFKPDIQASLSALKGNAAFTKPLYQRLDEVIQQKQDQRQHLQIINQKDHEYPFKPSINPTSEMLAQDRYEGKPVVQRLLDDIKEKAERKARIADTHHQSISQLCTFQPSINPSNKDDSDITANHSYLNNTTAESRQKDFVQRQLLMADYIKERLEAKIKEVYSSSEYSFKPKVNPISQYLVEADQERAAESASDKLKRLCDQDQLKKQITQEQLTKAYYDKFTFQPAINPLSKRIARKRSLDSLAFDKQKNSKKKQLKEKVEGARMEECSFQPQTNKNKKFDGIKSHYALESLSSALKEEKESKEKSIQQIKKEMEYQEMKECTFNPTTKQLNSMDYEERLIGMRGVDKFLKNKEYSKKQLELKNQRSQEVFSIKDQSQFRDSNKTILQPFSLSKGNGPNQKKLREELLRECLEQCTFNPETNEKKNKELIQRIIASTTEPQAENERNSEQQPSRLNYSNGTNKHKFTRAYDQDNEDQQVPYEVEEDEYALPDHYDRGNMYSQSITQKSY